MFAGSVGAGVFAGIVWALWVPAQQVLVVDPGSAVLLTGENLHRFDAAAMFACAGMLVGVLTAAASWTVRRSRGPVLLAALLAGAGAGAGAMAAAGLGVQMLRFSTVSGAGVGDVVATAPGLGTPLVLVFQPIAAAVVIAVLALLSPYDDLGVGEEGAAAQTGETEQAGEAEQADATTAEPDAVRMGVPHQHTQ